MTFGSYFGAAFVWYCLAFALRCEPAPGTAGKCLSRVCTVDCVLRVATVGSRFPFGNILFSACGI